MQRVSVSHLPVTKDTKTPLRCVCKCSNYMHMLLAYEVDAEPQLQACLQEALLTVHKVENAGRVSLLTSARVMWYGGSCNGSISCAICLPCCLCVLGSLQLQWGVELTVWMTDTALSSVQNLLSQLTCTCAGACRVARFSRKTFLNSIAAC